MMNMYLQFMVLKFALQGMSIITLDMIWLITSQGNYIILSIHNDASIKNAKENQCLRVENERLFRVSKVQTIKKTALMHFTINNLMVVLVLVCM